MATLPPLTVADMPFLGTKGAPKKFKGKSADVETFLRHYERMIAKYNLTTDKEKVENITQYCSKAVRQFMEGLTSYGTPDWTAFAKDLRKFYEADKDSRRYKVRDLEAFVLVSRSKEPFSSLAAWMRYNREFIRIAGWLRQKGKIDKEEQEIYFWKGIPRRFRDRLEFRLMSSKPQHNLDEPFEIPDVTKAAESLLKRDRFDNDRLPSDSEESDSEDSDSSSSESDSESEDEKVKVTSKKKSKKSHSKSKDVFTKKPRFRISKSIRSVSSSESESDNASSTKAKSGSSTSSKASNASSKDEFEDLIEQLGRMSLKDPEYAKVYFKAYRIDPIIKDLVPTPNEQRRAQTPPPRGRDRSIPERDIPPHMASPTDAPVRPSSMTCFGCGKTGHSMRSCPDIGELAQKGVIKLGANNQWMMSNGTAIFRAFMGEPLIDAVRRLQASSTNLVTVEEEEANDQDEEVFAVQYPMRQDYDFFKDDPYDLDLLAYPVQPATRSGRRADGGYAPPPRKDSGVRSTTRPARGKENIGSRPTQGPVEVDVPMFNPDDDNDIIEDTRPVIRGPRGKPPGIRASDLPDSNQTSKDPKSSVQQEESAKRTPRQSELQHHVNPVAILDKLLSAPVNLQVGELMAVSKEMTQRMQEVLKPKQNKPGDSTKLVTTEGTQSEGPATVAAFMPKTRSQLIRLTMYCHGIPIETIIDTGSMLNICSKRTWLNCIKQPVDVTRSVVMNDANGGEGTLSGFLAEVPLRCGDVLTYANMYVGENAPFDLLLGRPWQRGNFITIDERLEGTFLVFKDRELNNQWEMIVAEGERPDEMREDYLAKTRQRVIHAYLAMPDNQPGGSAKIEEVRDETESQPEITSVGEAERRIAETTPSTSESHWALESLMLALDFPEGLVEREVAELEASTAPSHPSPAQKVESETVFAAALREEEYKPATLSPAVNIRPEYDISKEEQGIEDAAKAQPPAQPMQRSRPSPIPSTIELSITERDANDLEQLACARLNCGGLTFQDWYEGAQMYLSELHRCEQEAIANAWAPHMSRTNAFLTWRDDERMGILRNSHRWDMLEQDRKVLGQWMNVISEWQVERAKPNLQQVRRQMIAVENRNVAAARDNPAFVGIISAQPIKDPQRRSTDLARVPKCSTCVGHRYQECEMEEGVRNLLRQALPFPLEEPARQGKRKRHIGGRHASLDNASVSYRVEHVGQDNTYARGHGDCVRQNSNSEPIVSPDEGHTQFGTYRKRHTEKHVSSAPESRTQHPAGPNGRLGRCDSTASRGFDTEQVRNSSLAGNGGKTHQKRLDNANVRESHQTRRDPVILLDRVKAHRSRARLTCWGCGKPGHRLARCRDIDRRVRDGRLQRSAEGQIMTTDGELVVRKGRETMIEAAVRQRRDAFDAFQVGNLVNNGGDGGKCAKGLKQGAYLRKPPTNSEEPDTAALNATVYSSKASQTALNELSRFESTLPNSQQPAMPVAISSNGVRRVYRILNILRMTHISLVDLPEGLVQGEATICFMSCPFTTKEEAERESKSQQILQASHLVHGHVLLTPSAATYWMPPIQFPRIEGVEVVSGERTLQGTLTLVRPETERGHLVKPVPVLERFVVLSAAHELPGGTHPVGWTMLMSIGRVDTTSLAFVAVGKGGGRKDDEGEGAMEVVAKREEEDGKESILHEVFTGTCPFEAINTRRADQGSGTEYLRARKDAELNDLARWLGLDSDSDSDSLASTPPRSPHPHCPAIKLEPYDVQLPTPPPSRPATPVKRRVIDNVGNVDGQTTGKDTDLVSQHPERSSCGTDLVDDVQTRGRMRLRSPLSPRRGCSAPANFIRRTGATPMVTSEERPPVLSPLDYLNALQDSLDDLLGRIDDYEESVKATNGGASANQDNAPGGPTPVRYNRIDDVCDDNDDIDSMPDLETVDDSDDWEERMDFGWDSEGDEGDGDTEDSDDGEDRDAGSEGDAVIEDAWAQLMDARAAMGVGHSASAPTADGGEVGVFVVHNGDAPDDSPDAATVLACFETYDPPLSAMTTSSMAIPGDLGYPYDSEPFDVSTLTPPPYSQISVSIHEDSPGLDFVAAPVEEVAAPSSLLGSMALTSQVLLAMGGAKGTSGGPPVMSQVQGGGLPLVLPTPDQALSFRERYGQAPPWHFAGIYFNRRTIVKQTKPLIDRAHEQGLQSFLDKYRSIQPFSRDMEFALATLFFPKHTHDGCPYLDPVEELEVLQARVFFAVTNPFLEQHSISTLDRVLAYRTNAAEHGYIVFLRANGYLGGDWSIPAHGYQPPVARYSMLSC
ncbi:hypothetical protein BC629DRAFT_1600777 [Irpex lacteus]|nr:hypothetical protein BC629DRAFT_1600777 [Irpex lacteus]